MLPLHINEKGIDIESGESELYLTIDKNHFDTRGYFYFKNRWGEFIKTGVTHNPKGYRKDGTHILKSEGYSIMNVLRAIHNHGIIINNSLIQYSDTLKDVVEKCPEEYREDLQKEFVEFEESYPIGQEYNFVKAAYRLKSFSTFFGNFDIKDIYAYGLFEEIDSDYLNGLWSKTDDFSLLSKNQKISSNGFLVFGPKKHLGLNAKTGTLYDELGNPSPLMNQLTNIEEICKNDFIILRYALKILPEGYSFAHEESSEDTPHITLGRITDYYYRNKNWCYYGNPTVDGLSLTRRWDKDLYNTMQSIKNNLDTLPNNMDIDQVIEYKKLGIIPLRIDANGLDIDTGKPKDFFGKSIMQHEVSSVKLISQAQFRVIYELLKSIEKTSGATFPNKSFDDLSDKNFLNSIQNIIKRIDPNNSMYLTIADDIKDAQEYLRYTPMPKIKIEEYKRLRTIAITNR